MQGPPDLPTRTNTPRYTDTPSQPSPTVSEFGETTPGKLDPPRISLCLRGTLITVSFALPFACPIRRDGMAAVGNGFNPQGMSEDQALEAAIRASQQETTHTASASSSLAFKPYPSYKTHDPRPHPQYLPPPGPPPADYNDKRSSERRGTRSPTPGPPEIEKRKEGQFVVGSNNPFRNAMTPSGPASGPGPTDAGSVTPSTSIPDGQGQGKAIGTAIASPKNVHFQPPSGPNIKPLFASPGLWSADSAPLKKVDDSVVDLDRSRGMVLAPRKEGSDEDTEMVSHSWTCTVNRQSCR
jgi:hypothetical protein